MSIDDGAAYRQPHARSIGLRGVEGVRPGRDAPDRCPAPESRTATRTPAWSCSVLINSSRGPVLNRAHCFSRVQNQIQQDLLQLNAIPQNRKQSIRKPGLDRNAISEGHASRQYDHLVDCRVKIKTLLSRRRFLDVLTDTSMMSPARSTSPTTQASASLTSRRSGRLHVQKILGRPGVVACGGDRLQ